MQLRYILDKKILRLVGPDEAMKLAQKSPAAIVAFAVKVLPRKRLARRASPEHYRPPSFARNERRKVVYSKAPNVFRDKFGLREIYLICGFRICIPIYSKADCHAGLPHTFASAAAPAEKIKIIHGLRDSAGAPPHQPRGSIVTSARILSVRPHRQTVRFSARRLLSRQFTRSIRPIAVKGSRGECVTRISVLELPIVTHLTNPLAPRPFPLPPLAPVLISISPKTGMDPQ